VVVWGISLLILPEQNATGWVAETTGIYSLQSWRLEVQDQVVGRFGFVLHFFCTFSYPPHGQFNKLLNIYSSLYASFTLL
jgi:hypothetical protein